MPCSCCLLFLGLIPGFDQGAKISQSFWISVNLRVHLLITISHDKLTGSSELLLCFFSLSETSEWMSFGGRIGICLSRCSSESKCLQRLEWLRESVWMTRISRSVQQLRAEVVLSLLLVPVYFSSGLRTEVGTILKFSTI